MNVPAIDPEILDQLIKSAQGASGWFDQFYPGDPVPQWLAVMRSALSEITSQKVE